MTSRTKDAWPARAGLPLGLALAALAVSGWVMPAGNPPDGVAATVTVGPTGEVDVTPAGRIARARNLKVGDDIAGRFAMTNQTGSALAVSVRAALPTRDLDTRLQFKATVGRRTLANGTLGQARAWSRPVLLGPGERRRAMIRLSVPPGARGYDERKADIRIELRSEPAR